MKHGLYTADALEFEWCRPPRPEPTGGPCRSHAQMRSKANRMIRIGRSGSPNNPQKEGVSKRENSRKVQEQMNGWLALSAMRRPRPNRSAA
jgi:hypothetical protein